MTRSKVHLVRTWEENRTSNTIDQARRQVTQSPSSGATRRPAIARTAAPPLITNTNVTAEQAAQRGPCQRWQTGKSQGQDRLLDLQVSNILALHAGLLVLFHQDQAESPILYSRFVMCFQQAPSSPPERSGEPVANCIHGRKRKIKCDEGYPACLCCTSTGRSCGGYADPEGSSSRRAISTSPPLPPAVLGSSLGVHDEAETRALTYFITIGARLIAGHAG
jgi:hypothetical protein